MKTAKPTTVDEYIDGAPREGQKHLRDMRAVLKKVTPEGRESLKWGMPVFEENRILFAFAAFKSHLGFMPTPSAMKPFEVELKKYKTGKGSIQFPYEKPLPKTLIRKIASYRARDVRENDARWM
ncbi:MAG TPA: DUF1801 domain-containing protein [Chryseosolibacter sp.]